ncbi:MAG TPA: SLC13 family permease [Bacteroidota bacterium]|nr:SLC13 family permease [Bacteroidota bacterium]
MHLSIAILLLVFVLIAVRQIGGLRLQIWHIMTAGALMVLVTGEISPSDAAKAVDMDVMVFLFAMFVVGHALEESGYLSHLSYQYFKRARTLNALLMMVIGGSALTSALLMNDTLAVIGTPVMLLLARKHLMPAKALLIALMFSVTIGSVMSPIGNPQNLLIAIDGNVQSPFVTFLAWLFIPTAVNLAFLYWFLKSRYRSDFHDAELKHSQEPIRDHEMAVLSKLSLQFLVLLVFVKIVMGILRIDAELRLTHIAVAASLPLLVGSSRRFLLVKNIDWATLVFFASMFVLMESVWNSGFFQSLLSRINTPLTSYHAILGVSVLLSQFISNVPLVALYQPILITAGVLTPGLMALAAGSTIAGNLTILGAASNVIVIQAAERREKVVISFVEFVRIGLPVTLVNTVVYWLHLVVVGSA